MVACHTVLTNQLGRGVRFVISQHGCEAPGGKGPVRRRGGVIMHRPRPKSSAKSPRSEGETGDKELEERLFRELSCFYMPSGVGMSCKVWLEHIAEELR